MRRLVIFGLFLGLSACGGPSDPIQALLDRAERAAEDRDATALRACLADDFAGPDGLTADAAADLARRSLAGYETVALDVYDVDIEREPGSARVELRADFTGEARKIGPLAALLPPGASYRFDLELATRDGEWRVVHASWEPAPLAGPE
jgi:hypothetical protein